MKPIRLSPKLERELNEVLEQPRKPQTQEQRRQTRIIREALKKMKRRHR